MKEIKAFIHRSRVADVVHALLGAEYRHLSVIDVLGTLEALGRSERLFSLELGEQVVSEAKIEVVCEDHRVDQAVALINDNAHTAGEVSGCIVITDIEAVHMVNGD